MLSHSIRSGRRYEWNYLQRWKFQPICDRMDQNPEIEFAGRFASLGKKSLRVPYLAMKQTVLRGSCDWWPLKVNARNDACSRSITSIVDWNAFFAWEPQMTWKSCVTRGQRVANAWSESWEYSGSTSYLHHFWDHNCECKSSSFHVIDITSW